MMKKRITTLLLAVLTAIPSSGVMTAACSETETNITAEAEGTNRILGDINYDGSVNIGDALALFQHSMLPEMFPIDYPGTIDFDNNGNVDINDALRLFQHSMLPEIFPIEWGKTDEDSNENDNVDPQQGFSIKGEKYPYQNNDVLILDVENTTDTHYTATLTVTFYNEAGEAIKTQEKTIEQFPAKYKQTCLFQPNLQFASYTCEISLEEYTDTVYLSTLSGKKNNVEVRRLANKPTGKPNERKTVITVHEVESSFGPCTSLPEGKNLKVRWDVVVLDNTGEIFTIARQNHIFGNTDTIEMRANSVIVLSSTENLDLQIPDELKGEVIVILALAGYEFIDAYNG